LAVQNKRMMALSLALVRICRGYL